MGQAERNRSFGRHLSLIGLIIAVTSLSGCQQLQYWWQNDMTVGPNYYEPETAVATQYRDAFSPKIDTTVTVDPLWWNQFGDPDLNLLIEELRQQNLTLKAAACRIAEARALSNIAAANLLPQSQSASAQYSHTQNSANSGTAFPGFPVTVDNWALGFDSAWELDLWGRIRRTVDAADAQVEASVKDYDFAMVTLIGDVASLYIQIRALEERIVLAEKNIGLQAGNLEIADKRFVAGRTSELDVVQAKSNLAATQSLLPQLELARQQSLNALAVLLGMPPSDIPYLSETLGRVPEIPPQLMVGIPANLILRRPDIRSAERLMAAQFEQIGIAEAELYPTLAVSGTLGYQAARFSDVFDTNSFTGTIAPGFRWNILNFGRIQNNVRVQEARFKQIRFDFENQVLGAQREVEDGIIEFIKRSEQYQFDLENAKANEKAVELAVASYIEGKEDFGRVFVVQSNLVTAQDRVVDTRANIALAVIRTYKSLGGGWEIRCIDDVSGNTIIAPSQ